MIPVPRKPLPKSTREQRGCLGGHPAAPFKGEEEGLSICGIRNIHILYSIPARSRRVHRDGGPRGSIREPEGSTTNPRPKQQPSKKISRECKAEGEFMVQNIGIMFTHPNSASKIATTMIVTEVSSICRNTIPGPARIQVVIQENHTGNFAFRGVVAHDQTRTNSSVPGYNDHFEIQECKSWMQWGGLFVAYFKWVIRVMVLES